VPAGKLPVAMADPNDKMAIPAAASLRQRLILRA
jgi:hypothetical protein